MESIWKTHGIQVEKVWNKYGIHVEKPWNPSGKPMESIHHSMESFPLSMESIPPFHGIHPPFHGIHLEFLQSIPPSMDSTWNNPGRVKYWKFTPKELLLGLVVNTKPTNIDYSTLPTTEHDITTQMAYTAQQRLDGVTTYSYFYYYYYYLHDIRIIVFVLVCYLLYNVVYIQ